VRKLDLAAMFASLWLLAAMVIDAVTPKELTVYMIGVAIAPATIVLAVLYWLRIARIDFAVVFATLWMITTMALEIIAPKPLSAMAAVIAVAPMVIVGSVVNYQRWRSGPRQRPAPLSS
jgi:hypothetical protein